MPIFHPTTIAFIYREMVFFLDNVSDDWLLMLHFSIGQISSNHDIHHCELAASVSCLSLLYLSMEIWKTKRVEKRPRMLIRHCLQLECEVSHKKTSKVKE